MKTAIRITIWVVLFGFVSIAQAGDGELSGDMIDDFKSSLDMDNHTRAMYNAITNNDINKLALNRDILREHNEVFSHKIKAKGISNQKSSGRCWLFAGLNIMRPAVAVNWALRQIGKRNKNLNRLAIKTGERIANIDSRPVQWIASDALRELRSDKVQSRLT